MTTSTPRGRSRRAAQPSSPSEIAPGVFVGGWSDAPSFKGRRYCVLDERPAEALPADEQITIYDGEGDRAIPENLDRLAGLVEEARSGGEPVLLFCGHGVRRGPLAGAWYLHRHEGLAFPEAYARIRAVRPGVEEAGEWIGHWSEPAASRTRPTPRHSA
ncbi:MAG: hypothetical protein L3K11_02085 [Thermoplasmata archaeon]|nr:hypothetical protein [Thermoplasmata archaeon]